MFESDSLNIVGDANKLANPEVELLLWSSTLKKIGDDEGVNCSALKKLEGLFMTTSVFGVVPVVLFCLNLLLWLPNAKFVYVFDFFNFEL